MIEDELDERTREFDLATFYKGAMSEPQDLVEELVALRFVAEELVYASFDHLLRASGDDQALGLVADEVRDQPTRVR